MPAHRNHQEAYYSIYHMQQSIDCLLIASKNWKPEDAARGERTLVALERQIAEARAEFVATR